MNTQNPFSTEMLVQFGELLESPISQKSSISVGRLD